MEFEKIYVALEKLENRKRPFLAINPYGKVPVLKDGDFILSESVAILRYLEEKYPDTPKMFPSDLETKAILNQMAGQCETEFCFPGSILYFAKRFVPEEKWDLKRMKDSSKKIQKHLAILNQKLEGKEFLTENKFGFLEVLYAPFLANIGYMEVELPENVKSWIDRVLEQGFVKEGLKKDS